jgi:N-acetyl-gamma-glutamyl-phosphate reductase
MQRKSVAILGASGYTGAELIRLLLLHPYVEIKILAAHSQAGQNIAQIFPHLSNANLPEVVHIDDVNYDNIDLVFCCLPHAASQKIISNLPDHVRIIDLSADFRLRDVGIYEQYYHSKHLAPELQQTAIYGLSEHYRNQIKNARLIANPGCYPTCSLLPLIPLLQHKMLAAGNIIIDAKSGVSGAGRAVAQHLLFNEVAEGMNAYAINNHRHIGELIQEINAFGGQDFEVTFVPHLIPMKRGMLATIYAQMQPSCSINDVRNALMQAYQKEEFVHVLPENTTPSTHMVRGSNHCFMNVMSGGGQRIIIISVIDNLLKGASGQAVQNMNIMLRLPEQTGLQQTALFP